MSRRMVKCFVAFMFVLCSLTMVARAGEMTSVMIPNGLYEAEAGDWVMFKMADGSKMKYSVVSRTGPGEAADITLRAETFDGDRMTASRRWVQKVGPNFMQPSVEGLEENDKAKKNFSFNRREDTINFDGSKMGIQIIEVFDGNNLIRTWYLSTEIPVFGVIKRVGRSKAADFEVVDFGFAEGEGGN